jgi:uncharacterized membrane protein
MEALFYCMATGVLWGLATLIARLSGLGSWMMATMISMGSVIAMLPMLSRQSFAAAGSKALAIGLGAGLINGLGLLSYYQLVGGSNEGKWELSRVAPIALVMVPVVIAVGARFMFDEQLTTTKVVGIALACAAIWFLE